MLSAGNKSGALHWILLIVVCTCLLLGCGRQEEQASLKAEINKPAPDFTLIDLQGKEWHLADLRGKVIFVNFWATWCSPCQEEMPSMEALSRGMARAPFQMLAILNNDRPEYAQMLAAKLGITFPILLDPDSKVASYYGITGVPETFIIDPQGVLREKFIGPRAWNSQDAWQLLGQYMPRPPAAPASSGNTH